MTWGTPSSLISKYLVANSDNLVAADSGTLRFFSFSDYQCQIFVIISASEAQHIYRRKRISARESALSLYHFARGILQAAQKEGVEAP